MFLQDPPPVPQLGLNYTPVPRKPQRCRFPAKPRLPQTGQRFLALKILPIQIRLLARIKKWTTVHQPWSRRIPATSLLVDVVRSTPMLHGYAQRATLRCAAVTCHTHDQAKYGTKQKPTGTYRKKPGRSPFGRHVGMKSKSERKQAHADHRRWVRAKPSSTRLRTFMSGKRPDTNPPKPTEREQGEPPDCTLLRTKRTPREKRPTSPFQSKKTNNTVAPRP